ncbi:hypothetical protein L202_03482 [Cryptococcus amylolentus CBS 6039]|uniref:Fluoride ion transporter CrcB n=1 Tax=Cryptococcus amylolentus CBS 6039 TaxID=1295533 RepID=A0A1E3HT42_9TREE|nr:hypothetical protein L202_03482 [Cryptococcus amylolentus CBS 6039]ODN79520.1 hypothetical protein L202_03482 [Cryptococcus amylolentus CBS 6039]
MSSTPESPSPRLTESLDLKVSPKLPMLTFGSMPLTPPLTPPISLSPSKQSKPSSVKIHSPIDIASYPLPPDSYSHSLHIPLKAHLALAHPNTPPSVASFCARRLLSPEIPHGFESEWEWKPIHLQENGIDLQTAGVGKDATKELREGQNGPGKEADEKLEMMYGVARTSWRILESKVPTRNYPEHLGGPPPPPPPAPEANAPPPAEEVTHLRLGAHYGGLVLASMLGCLVRLGLSALGRYDGALIYPLAWSQGVGSGIMGLSLGLKNDISTFYPPLFTFLTTGIAGSITTFSSWMLEGYLAFSNFGNYNRKGLHDTVDGVAYSLSTFAIAMASLKFGEHLGRTLPHLPRQSNASAYHTTEKRSMSAAATFPSSPSTAARTPLRDSFTILTAALAYLVALLLYFLAPHSWRHDVTFPLLLSPPGAMLRFALSKLNIRRPFVNKFPIGTLLANMMATLLVASTFAAQRRPGGADHGAIRCNGLHAIQQGFCGCLSTVSTFVVEAAVIKRWGWKWFYIGGSVMLGHILVLAVVGATGWSEGYNDVCSG